MCRKADVARYRNALRVNEPMPFDDGAPAIDGLFIFPEPQEQVRDDGFVEFRVTAYGRTTQRDYILRGSALITVPLAAQTFNSSTGATTSVTISLRAIGDVFTIKRVLTSAASTASVVQSPGSLTPEINFISLPTDVGTYAIQKGLFLSQLSSVNFGVFSEFTYTYETTAFGFKTRTI